jgi:predicted dehydrogenase
VLSWEKYGIHLLDAVLGLTSARPVSVQMLPTDHAAAAVRLEDGVLLQIDALGESATTFHIEIFGTKRNGAFDITDNFSMFRRMLWEFTTSIRSGKPAIPAERTLDIMRVLIAGRISKKESREVLLNEISI